MLEHPVTAADCAFGVAFPLTREEFHAQWNAPERYELAALRVAAVRASAAKKGENPSNIDPWEGAFEETASEILSVCQEVGTLGVTVVTQLSLPTLETLLEQHKVVAVLAHHRSSRRAPPALELSEGFVDDALLVQTMPLHFQGVFDLGTCSSGDLSEALKAKAHHSRIVHAVAPMTAVFVAYRFATAMRFLDREPELYTDVICRISSGLAVSAENSPESPAR